MTSLVFNIQRFSTHDGPGIRTTVFLKGCNLNCFWCHNPESISAKQEVQFFPEKCVGCGNCFEVCPVHAHRMEPTGTAAAGTTPASETHHFDRALCTACGRCVDECYAQALVHAARPMSVDEVVAAVEQDAAYYEESGGGVTFSGGEPLLSMRFLEAVLQGCRERGIHTAVDTALNVPWDRVAAIEPLVDLWLVDFKHIDPAAHERAVGVPNERILANLRGLGAMAAEWTSAERAVAHRVAATGADVAAGAASGGRPRVWVRVPVIPGVNDDREVLAEMARFLAGAGSFERVELLPFHRLAGSKYESLGRDYRAAGLETPAPNAMDAYRGVFREAGVVVG